MRTSESKPRKSSTDKLMLSIAMTTCNGERYLNEQLESFLRQTRLPDEVVISDDASTDNTLAQLDAFAEKAPFRVILLKNSDRVGSAQNFNRSLEKTTGDLVFLSDQDDVWFEQKLEVMEQKALSHPNVCVHMNDAVFTDTDLKPFGFTKLEQLRKGGYSKSMYVMGCVAAVRRELLDIALPIPSGYRAHDNWLIGIADLLDFKRIHDIPLQFYRRHGKNESVGLVNRKKPISRASVWSQRIRSALAPVNVSAQTRSIEHQRACVHGLERVVRRVKPHDLARVKQRLEKERGILASKEIWVHPLGVNLSDRVRAIQTVLTSGEFDKAFGLRSALLCLRGASL